MKRERHPRKDYREAYKDGRREARSSSGRPRGRLRTRRRNKDLQNKCAIKDPIKPFRRVKYL